MANHFYYHIYGLTAYISIISPLHLLNLKVGNFKYFRRSTYDRRSYIPILYTSIMSPRITVSTCGGIYARVYCITVLNICVCQLLINRYQHSHYTI